MSRGNYGYHGIYNSSPITLTNGEGSAAALDVNGNTLVAPAAGTSFGSSTADGATFTQNSSTGSIEMGVYVSSPQTLTSGKSAAIALDVNRNQLSSLATLIAGENLTTNRLNVEPIYSYARMTTAATLLVKTGAGTLHAIVVNTPVASGTIEFDDALTNTTPIIGKITYPGTLISDGPDSTLYDVSFATGLSITTTGTMDITIAYR